MSAPGPDRLLIIGRSGQLARALATAAPDAVAVGRERFDLATGDAHALLDGADPTVVVNTGAYTAVDRAEDEPELARALNAQGPARLAAACAERGVGFVHVSTDYVFDGLGGAPYGEDAPARPVNVYGQSKHLGETRVREACPDAIIVRASWIFDERGGSFLPAILRRVEAGQPLTVVNDQISAPTYASDLAEALLTIVRAEAGAPSRDGGVFHYLGGVHASRFDFARAALELTRKRFPGAQITPVDSSAFPTSAARPKDTRLKADKIAARFAIAPGDWRKGLKAVLTARYGE